MRLYIFRTLIIVLVSTPIYLVIRRPWRYKNKREIALAVFVIYMLCLLTFTLEGDYSSPLSMLKQALLCLPSGDRINIIPFRTICSFFNGCTVDEFWINIVSNVVIFVPFGFLLPFVNKRFLAKKYHVLACLGITCFVEFVQLFIGRHSDIDDIFLNFIGGLIGVIIYYTIGSKIADKCHKQS